MPAGGSCLLGSLNLSEFVKNPFTDEATFDFGRFKDCIRICIRALNEVLDEGMDLHPLEEQRRSAADLRQIGLGIMGLADMLIKLGIAYGEEASIILCDEIGFTMADTAIAESALLAEKEGAYPKCCAGEIIAAPYFQANTTKETKELVKNTDCGTLRFLRWPPQELYRRCLEYQVELNRFMLTTMREEQSRCMEKMSLIKCTLKLWKLT